jgi:glycine/D-amino acid oxidase-like deaminating enzyme
MAAPTGQVTIVGGGLAGLIAAVELAEHGTPARVFEARHRLGGRGASLAGPYAANLGPHALYAGTGLWDWLDRRGLARPAPRPTKLGSLRLRWRGQLRATPPRALLGLRRLASAAKGAGAPVDVSFRAWATEVAGAEAAMAVGGAAGALTFDHDPGRLSAAFVWERFDRILLHALPTARYVEGGWSAVVERLAARARELGVKIETGAKVESLEDVRGPVIVALEPGGARRLLRDDALRPECPRVALVDLALRTRRGDPYVVADLDDAAFATRTTAVVPSHAPDGEELVQVSMGMRPDEALEEAVDRLGILFDLAYDGWRERTTWSRRAAVREATGAVDLPGTTWRDRTPVAYADGVWLAGDWVAAPGHLAEVSCTSAIAAARGATGRSTAAVPALAEVAL